MAVISGRRVAAIALVIAFIAMAISAYPLARWIDRRSRPEIHFYGQVVDQSGRPVPDAWIVAWVWHVRWDIQKFKRLDDAGSHLFARTDSSGRFTINTRGVALCIDNVQLPGRQLLYDLAWDYLPPGNQYDGNRFFHFQVSAYPEYPLYKPDPLRPAIFPLYDGDRPPGVFPSRGGSDLYPDGHVVVNQPVKPRFPSVGPGSPQNQTDMQHIVQQLLSPSRPTSAPAAPDQSQPQNGPETRQSR